MNVLTKICKIIPLLFLSGCAPYKVSTTAIAHPSTAEHPLYDVVPRHRCQIQPYDLGHWVTWTLFGNDDGGLFGEDNPHPYCPDYPIGGGKAFSWMVRNPLHNFCYYVVGSANRTQSELTLLEITPAHAVLFQTNPVAHRVFADPGGGLFVALHGGKPFISLKIPYGPRFHGEFYLGWRYRGNFGAKFRPWTRSKQSGKMKAKRKS